MRGSKKYNFQKIEEKKQIKLLIIKVILFEAAHI